MAIAAERDAVIADTRARRPGSTFAAAALVALVAVPIATGALALVGKRWLPLGDWASLAFRTSQVGGLDTPLVGPYSSHGWAHPGPLLYWLAAPLFRLMGEDPRSLLWSGAILNTLMVLAIGAVAWRRGRWPLLMAVLLTLTLLLHGLGPGVVLDTWNPYSPLLPFLLAVLLVWDAALGRSRALVEAAVPASFAVQTHLAFVPLLAVVGAWYWAWTCWQRRVVPGSGEGGPPEGERRALRLAAAVTVILWVPPLIDALLDLHNPWNVARSLSHNDVTVGPGDAVSLVGRYVAPAGLWLKGNDEVIWMSARAIDALYVMVAVGVLAACLAVARRRRLVDAAALATLTLALLAASIAATAQLVSPPLPYLAEWLKITGALVWLTAGWTAWRVAEPTLHAGSTARRAVGGVAAAGLVAGAALGADRAAGVEPPHGAEPAMLAALRAGWRTELVPGRNYRVEVLGDPFAHFAGLTYWMLGDGIDVVTGDGAAGLKWGHDHRWAPGDEVAAVITVAVGLPNRSGVVDECRTDDRVDEIAAWAGLNPAEQHALEDLQLRRLDDPGSLTAADAARGDALAARDVEVALFVGDELCGRSADRASQAAERASRDVSRQPS